MLIIIEVKIFISYIIMELRKFNVLNPKLSKERRKLNEITPQLSNDQRKTNVLTLLVCMYQNRITVPVTKKM